MKLKLCPLCESEVKRDQRLKKILSHVKNTDCPLDGLYASDKEWNNRPGEKAARVGALEDALQAFRREHYYEVRIGSIHAQCVAEGDMEIAITELIEASNAN